MKNYVLNEGYQKKDIFDKATGIYVFKKKKKFIDLSCCSGANLLGHNTKLNKKIFNDFVKKNISNTSLPNIHCVNFSKNLKKVLPNFSKFIFCNSGSESIIKAIRICRAITKNKKIVAVTGSWHGSVDQFLYMSNKNLKKIPLSDGLNKEEEKNLILIPYNDKIKSLKILKKNKNQIACIILEPIQGCLPSIDSKEYINFLFKFCQKNKIKIIFDEMITGLRTDGKSLQAMLRIKTDISTFGKAFGNGVPVSFIAISQKLENEIKNKNIYFGGTFSGNSQNMYFANESIKYILKNKKKIFNNLNDKAEKFEFIINDFCTKNKIDAKMYRFTSMLRLVFSNKNIQSRPIRDFLEKNKNIQIIKFKKFLLSKKIYYPSNGIIFLSNSLNEKNINYIIKSFKLGLKKFFYK